MTGDVKSAETEFGEWAGCALDPLGAKLHVALKLALGSGRKFWLDVDFAARLV